MNLTAMILTIGIPILAGVFGFFLGAVKFFREEKQKAYRELLPPILKFAYHPESPKDEEEFNKALSTLWLYGNKDVTKKMDTAVSILHNHNKGDMTRAFQKVIISMRRDLRIWRWQRLKPEEVNHLYSRIIFK